jgi:ABC-type sulfate transport system permease component
VLKGWEGVWVASDSEILGLLEVTVLGTSYQALTFSCVCQSGVALILSDVRLPGAVSL